MPRAALIRTYIYISRCKKQERELQQHDDLAVLASPVSRNTHTQLFRYRSASVGEFVYTASVSGICLDIPCVCDV